MFESVLVAKGARDFKKRFELSSVYLKELKIKRFSIHTWHLSCTCRHRIVCCQKKVQILILVLKIGESQTLFASASF